MNRKFKLFVRQIKQFSTNKEFHRVADFLEMSTYPTFFVILYYSEDFVGSLMDYVLLLFLRSLDTLDRDSGYTTFI